MDKHVIMGVHITDRVKHAVDVQKVLTTYGRQIRTRLGLHETGPDATEPNGVLVLELTGRDETHRELGESLSSIDGVEVQTMVFDHP